MIIEDFQRLYGTNTKTTSIDDLVDSWTVRSRVDEVLSTPIMGSVLLADWLSGKRIADIDYETLEERVPSEVREAFADLMGERADTAEKVRDLLIEKYRGGDASLMGLLNKIQGQLGENQFLQATDGFARLAPSGSQEGWDVVVGAGSGARYVQVKVYADPNTVVKHMEAVNRKVDEGKLLAEDGQTVVRQVEFAVNTDILDAVRAKANASGLHNPVLDLGTSREDIRSWISAANEQAMHPPLESFFADVLQSALSASAMNAAINGFLVWYGAKERNTAIEDTAYATIVSAGFFTTAHAVSQFIGTPLDLKFAMWGEPVAGAIAFVIASGARSALRRLADRRFVARRLAEGNEHLRSLSHMSDAPKMSLFSTMTGRFSAPWPASLERALATDMG